MAFRRCGVTVTIGCVDCSMSSFSNSWISEAWIAAPRAASSEGLMAVGYVDGERIAVDSGKTRWRSVAIFGVWEVPPDRITLRRC